ncbi:TetR/AcrR family transcriptional regulator [Paenibacillus sp. SC116]|uniref:TetR/AcrR family transcriptional regulator n=1 Tax=Paenibacillus sp. SC116 TaxID=2968986 RepID=UPI00215A9830|nr:TetR/AcrR family transcriptional regulator [Paenibacillus sp. SC116]MCR8844713.1 TetR/AcrR family transcriptional regulator [Paenibacillus sp. SC116]
MTANRIQQVALTHFAEHGYAETSLAMIAEEVGIKKPSIYAHFKSKDDLFLRVVQNVFQSELNYITKLAEEKRELPLQQMLPLMLSTYQERYDTHPDMKFMLRTSFFPPSGMEQEVMERLYTYLDTLEKYVDSRITAAVQTGEIGDVDAEQAARAFLCLLDGFFVELLYGGPERASRRLEAAWLMFWRGLSK